MKNRVGRRGVGIEVGLTVVVVALGLVAWGKSAELPGGSASAPTTGSLTALPAQRAFANFLEAQTRARVARVRTDMRSLAVACEAYYVDNNMYPAFSVGAKSVNGLLGTSIPASLLPSFSLPESLPREGAARLGQSLRFMTLTTPIAYIVRYPSDPFTSGSKATFVYWSVRTGEPDPAGKTVSAAKAGGWILVSPGPDGDYDLAGEWDAYNPAVSLEKSRLLSGTNKKGSALTYDPTNGTVSDGDIWRIRQ